ncbi:ATP-binding protein [Staphylococcus aureus]|uniref:ATP-binding protein n=1 Tax=Staphylococcus aureus TaxID=1280 RepID=UPI0008DAAA5D|nr:ATP-binding protein [Staphylococcus aureus]MBU6128700.1 ATP-binding protein [Staphylococcus aureus]MCJ8093517.1 ATP-binding protein [Staphylococcus aureus]MCL4577570.1 AAA family ATPase [Staphylococcus aureus]NFW90453.1 AAA family ATPase [Staphylococcus aureus]OHW03316.1 AAA family ATPase [Staphylococcus aureus]
MKKKYILNLIKYHTEKDDNAFKQEAIKVAKSFDIKGDYQLAEYIMSLISSENIFTPQERQREFNHLKYVEVKKLKQLNLPHPITEDVKGIINAIKHNVGINKFLFEGKPGSGKTEVAKHIARLLEKSLYIVDFNTLIDSKLGQTNKNINSLFDEINTMPERNNAVILFDEIDVIALDRINRNDIREMGRATSTMLKALDRTTELNRDLIIIATTNLFENFDKALMRRFDAVINFDKYSKEDLVEIAGFYFYEYAKSFKNISKDGRLLKKILRISNDLPYPGELKNIIKTSIAFSNLNDEYEYLRRLYKNINGDLAEVTISELYNQGFTLREIEKLTGESKSNISRKLNGGETNV